MSRRARPALTLADLRARVAAGAPVGDLRHLPRRVRDAVEVAERVGAPLLPAVEAAGAALDDEERTRRALHVATSQARAVAAGLVALPALLVPALGRLLDLDLVGFYRRGIGLAVAAVAGLLLVTGAVLVTVLVRRAGRSHRTSTTTSRRAAVLAALAVALVAGPWAGVVVALVGVALTRRGPSRHPGLDEVADLVATALAGGYGLAEALRVVADTGVADPPALRRLALAVDLGREPAPGPLAPLVAAAGAGLRWGAPAVPTLRALARDLRAEALADALAAAERLPAQLTFPLALCLLPASVLLVGAPLVVDGLAAAAGS